MRCIQILMTLLLCAMSGVLYGEAGLSQNDWRAIHETNAHYGKARREYYAFHGFPAKPQLGCLYGFRKEQITNRKMGRTEAKSYLGTKASFEHRSARSERIRKGYQQARRIHQRHATR